MRILVTGGAGFIGSHLVRKLLANGQDHVVNLDALRYSGRMENLTDVADHPHYAFVHGDIVDAETVQRVFTDYEIEAVINCAAESHVDRSLLDPVNFVKTDIIGTGQLLEAARTAGVRRFLQVSTDEVYGSVESGLSKEDDTLSPRSPYSASKAGADLLALSYWTSYQLPVMITRGSNTYGQNQYPEKFIPLVITNALENQPIPLYGDGHYRRDWLSVFDHCAAIECVLYHGKLGMVYNVGGGNEYENLAMVELIVNYLGKSKNLSRSSSRMLLKISRSLCMGMVTIDEIGFRCLITVRLLSVCCIMVS